MLVFIDLSLWELCRYFNVIGSDPKGRLGEAPRPELREHGRISGACFDAARGITAGLKVYLFYHSLSLTHTNTHTHACATEPKELCAEEMHIILSTYEE